MKKLIGHVPPEIGGKNPNVEKFIRTLDESIVEERARQLLKFENSINPYLSKENISVKNFLFDVGQLPRITGIPMFLIERFMLGAYTMFSLKGTKDGLELFALNSVDGIIDNIDNNLRSKEFLRPSNIPSGMCYLPNSLDGAESSDGKFPFIFGGSFSSYYGSISFSLFSDYCSDEATRIEWMRLLPEFLPMASVGSTEITVSFYTRSAPITFIQTLNI